MRIDPKEIPRISESQIFKKVHEKVEDNIKIQSYVRSPPTNLISSRQNKKMSVQHMRSNLSKIERMNKMNKNGRMNETKLFHQGVIDFKSNSP
jgi:hypothetical protein